MIYDSNCKVRWDNVAMYVDLRKWKSGRRPKLHLKA